MAIETVKAAWIAYSTGSTAEIHQSAMRRTSGVQEMRIGLDLVKSDQVLSSNHRNRSASVGRSHFEWVQGGDGQLKSVGGWTAWVQRAWGISMRVMMQPHTKRTRSG
jgi:hypothetical protein